MNFQSIRIGFDLDGVIAQHSLDGLWVQLRKIKEKILKKKHSSCYYYPSMWLEKRAWMLIDSRKRPFVDEKNTFNSLAKKRELQFFLVTGRFQFLEKLTRKWLTKHDLINNFRQLFINIEDIDPIIFKTRAINNLKLDFFIDDDLETINVLKKKTKAKFFWIVPPHKSESENNDNRVKSCTRILEALEEITNLPASRN